MSKIEHAFSRNPALLARVLQASSDSNHGALFDDISSYILDILHELLDVPVENGLEPNAKKRKLAPSTNGSSLASNESTRLWTAAPTVFVAQDISVAVPIRKKLRLEVVGSASGDGGIIALSPAGEKEITISWRDVDHIMSVPVPEKAQVAHYIVIIPVRSPAFSQTTEPVVFTIPGGTAKGASFPNGSDHVQDEEAYETLIRRVLDRHLLPYGKSVVTPDEREFVSSIVQAHRKTEKGWHVKAYRGSKDGFLYFLSSGILFGFKKPLLFFPFHAISSISYSSILQRTFNLNVTATTTDKDGQDAEEEIEFSMLDQADFPGIDGYVKRHGLNDASLAAARRAKLYNVNRETVVKQEDQTDAAQNINGSQANGDGGPVEDNYTMQEKAIQDAEDEEEEDYDPSGGSSEGSGDESEEEDDGGQEGDGEGDDDLDEAGNEDEEEEEEDELGTDD